MMKNLGKNLLLALIAISVLSLQANAKVKAKLKENSIISGDEAELWIESDDKNVEFPKIDKIGNYKIVKQYTNTAINYSSGKKEKKFIKKYIFHPQKSIDIPSYSLKVGGKIQKTKPLHLDVKDDPIDKKENIIFKMVADKKEAYINEPIVVEFVFKHKMNVPISDASFDSPKFKGFWVKKLRAIPNKTDIKTGYKLYKVRYLLYPQYSGVLHIDSGLMDIGMIASKKRRYYTFKSIRRKRIKSNSLDINVSLLPDGAELFGSFTFSGVADKTKVKANEPVNFTITIIGEGNIDDIKEFKLNIKNAEV
ncbi:MAG: hypothetical protein DSZ06_03380 [Sulfurospirillum sp.]|nr:MAG: hypothetical protein DSZ06_03380 [Sulfurospirillum sp.]